MRALLGTCTATLVACRFIASAATYYVDDLGGNDAKNGTSTGNAWKSLSKVSSVTFQPGDQILFKAGGSWVGELDLNGNGAPGNPIVVDKYGTGSKPRINGGGYEAAVRLQGVSHWEVNNLEILNNGAPTLSGAADYRAGVLVKSAFTAIRSHIHLRNLTIHDIFPETGAQGHGVHVLAACSATVDTYYDDVRVENCDISLTGRYGVWVQQTGSTSADPAYRFNRNVIIRNNTFTNVGGSGAETGWCSGVLLESNIVHNSGASVDPRQWARGSGYWPWKCTNVLVQFNQFRHARGEADSCGVHIDFGNRDVIIQYNLSLDNEGGFVEILGDCINSTYRYNVSINDGSRVKGVNGASQDGHLIWLSDYVGGGAGIGSINSQIYNNSIYVRPGITNYLKIMAKAQDTFIRNNIFYISGNSAYTDAGTNTVFENNLWHGNVPPGLPADPGAVFANPQFAQAGGTNAADYLISGTSPAIGAGAIIADNGGRDYWDNPLPVGLPCIGANQRDFAFVDPGIISVNFVTTNNQNLGPGFAFGIPSQNSMASNWLNLEKTFTAGSLPFESGASSGISLSGTTPGGWGVGNAAYNGTPLLSGAANYTNGSTPTTFTLQGLQGAFPLGCKIIVYLGGFISNTGASVSDGSTTNYFQPLAAPVAPVPLVQTLVADDPGSGNNPVAQYAVFGSASLLTNDSVTISLKALNGGGIILGGFQIRTAGSQTPHGVPYGWFQAFGIPIEDFADDDLDGIPAWQEFYAGTGPTNAASAFRTIELAQSGDDIVINWLGGVSGWQGSWSMNVSSNLIDWSMLQSKTIPRSSTGTNTWVHTDGILSGPTLYYRPCIEYSP